MCQAYEGEKRYLISEEKQQLREEYEKHVSGESIISDERLQEIAVRMIMLREG
jgi:tetrahydromethanopterin S-methyltransferase subunit A